MKKLLLFALTLSLGFSPYLHAQEDSFPDVPENYIYVKSIQNFKETDKIHGYPEDGEFKGLNRVKRAELFKIIAEALYSKEEIDACEYTEDDRPFDVERGSWYEPYICILQSKGVISGNDDGSMTPANNIEFSEVSKILAEAFDLDTSNINPEDPWETRYKLYFEMLEEVAAIPYSVDSASRQVTRAETVEAAWRLSENITDQVTKKADELVNPFPHIDSCVELKEVFNQHQYGYYPRPIPFVDDVMIFEEAMEFDAADGAAAPAPAEAPVATNATAQNKAASSESSDDFSTTNVQVEGIDEADIVKTDGEHIYLASQLSQSVRIVKAYPGEDMEEVAEIEMVEEGLSPQELYIDGNKLVVIASRGYYGITPFIEPMPVEPDGGIGDGAEPLPELLEEEEIDEPVMTDEMILPEDPYYYGPRTVVFVYDISNIKDGTSDEVVEERKIDLGSHYHTSRLMDGKVVLVANGSHDFWGFRDDMKGEHFLPTLQENNGQTEPVVSCGDVQYAPGLRKPNFMTLLSFDINSSESPLQKKVMLANSESVYMSRDHLYTTNTYFNPEMYTDWRWDQDRAKTHIYQFDLAEDSIEFSGRGEVEGTVLNQFSMDEFNDHLRIATTKGDLWNEQNPATNNVYVLEANGMNVVGELEGLAPNERIFSARFVGNRLYMVTFRQVDPLFVIDLEDPTDPNVLGKLKIPGYSDYLHPVDDDTLLGFGKDAVETKFGATVEGFKMGMFDVSDPKDPQELFTQVIGDRGTESELLWNHKALFYDADRSLVGFPITIIEEAIQPTVECEEFTYGTCPVEQGCIQQCQSSFCSEDPETGDVICTDDCDGVNSCFAPEYHSSTTFSGAMLYSFDNETGFTEEGRVTHYTEEDILKFGDWWGWDLEQKIQRLMFIGDYFYSVAFGGIKASDLDLEEVKFIELE